MELVVIGASSGGLDALITLLKALPREYRIPTVAVLHQRPNRISGVAEMLDNFTHMKVVEPEDKQPIEEGFVYVAPPNYHLFIEQEKVFSFSLDAPLNYSRPSIDMLFESAASAYGPGLVGCVLTGANSDGALGAETIKKKGGQVLVQSPKEAAVDVMPLAAIKATQVDEVLTLDELAIRLSGLRFGSAVA
ncbi:MAG: chemotaxis protein CheB [Pseudomonadales bacterium]|nr:chemotaxis protein CheB [Pseudomonadales bacterium]